jgi:spore coat polysaccharide biosynthesis protein SpsF
MGLSGYKIVGIIPQRMGSTRFYGKAILDMCGITLTEMFIERCKGSSLIDRFVLCVPDSPENDVFEDIAFKSEIEFYRYGGDENDVTGRILATAKEYDADIIVRLIIDNPLIESREIDRIIDKFLFDKDPRFLYSNTHNIQNNGYPDGLGCEVYDINMLEKTSKKAQSKEHPHKWFFDNDKVRTVDCPKEFAYPDIKLDVNNQKEYEFIRNIISKYGHDCHVTDYIREV